MSAKQALTIVDVTESTLVSSFYLDSLASPEHGGEASFTGRVRAHNMGREVRGVAYDVHETLAKKSFEAIAAQARAIWEGDAHIAIIHRQGFLKVGEASVLVAVTTAHRHEAFSLCRLIIDSIKHQTPIWKKEYYTDGESAWVQGHALCQKAVVVREG